MPLAKVKVWTPYEEYTLESGFDYDGPWYKRVGQDYCVWTADNMRTFWRTPDMGYLSSNKDSLQTVVNQAQFDAILAYYKECPDGKWIHKNGHHDLMPSAVDEFRDKGQDYTCYTGLHRALVSG
jgi:hypothetical protein